MNDAGLTLALALRGGHEQLGRHGHLGLGAAPAILGHLGAAALPRAGQEGGCQESAGQALQHEEGQEVRRDADTEHPKKAFPRLRDSASVCGTSEHTQTRTNLFEGLCIHRVSETHADLEHNQGL